MHTHTHSHTHTHILSLSILSHDTAHSTCSEVGLWVPRGDSARARRLSGSAGTRLDAAPLS